MKECHLQSGRRFVASPLCKHTLISLLEDQGLSLHPGCGRPASSGPQTAKSPAKQSEWSTHTERIQNACKGGNENLSRFTFVWLIWQTLIESPESFPILKDSSSFNMRSSRIYWHVLICSIRVNLNMNISGSAPVCSSRINHLPLSKAPQWVHAMQQELFSGI